MGLFSILFGSSDSSNKAAGGSSVIRHIYGTRGASEAHQDAMDRLRKQYSSPNAGVTTYWRGDIGDILNNNSIAQANVPDESPKWKALVFEAKILNNLANGRTILEMSDGKFRRDSASGEVAWTKN